MVRVNRTDKKGFDLPAANQWHKVEVAEAKPGKSKTSGNEMFTLKLIPTAMSMAPWIFDWVVPGNGLGAAKLDCLLGRRVQDDEDITQGDIEDCEAWVWIVHEEYNGRVSPKVEIGHGHHNSGYLPADAKNPNESEQTEEWDFSDVPF